jgi:hypothetical protein
MIVQANGSCADKSAWYIATHPGECWPFGGLVPLPAPIAATMPNTPPAAPVTKAAMTVPGVWTPDYAISRTQDAAQLENLLRQAGIDARTRTGRYEGGAGLPFPDVSGNGPGGHNWTLYAVAAGAVLLLLILRR